MIEVFKTNINCSEQAKQLVQQIQQQFAGYRANFDLDDCDRILRIISSSAIAVHFIDWLKEYGCHAEMLPDN
jgi:hypothetical protein